MKVKINNIELGVETTGNGLSVLLVPGGIGDRVGMHRIQNQLSNNFFVINYDRRNSGESSCLYDGINTTITSTHAGDLVELIKYLKYPSYVIGHSYGASIVLEAVGQVSSFLKGVIIIEPPIYSVLVELGEYELFDSIKKNYTSYINSIRTNKQEIGVKSFVDGALGVGSWDSIPVERQNILIKASLNYVDMMNEALNSKVDPKVLNKIKCPVLLIRGGNSGKSAEVVNQFLIRHLPDVKEVVIPHVGHGIFRSALQKVEAVINNFINSHE